MVEQKTTLEVGDRSFWFVQKDGGFTSAGVVIALLLVLALLFSTAQIYWVNSTAGDIQYAADAGALAAENVVAEYYVIARIADAVVLSMSLFGILVYGISIVVSCIPYCQSVGVKIMEFADKVLKTRDKITKQAGEMLIKVQKALPFLAAVNAASVIYSNSSSSGGAQYLGVAILVPWEAEPSKLTEADTSSSTEKIKEDNAETSTAADKSEEAHKKMEQAKLEGFIADCGDGSDPDYCMYERAETLAGLNGVNNPHFSSVDLWKFDYAFDRAKAYYQRRARIEAPSDQRLDERIRSAIRKQYYNYAIAEMDKGHAKTDADGALSAYFPLLAKNQSEMRSTSMFTVKMFPIDGDGLMHGVSDCPDFSGGASSWGSISDLDAGTFTSCETCDLNVTYICQVAYASSNISNGFEHHYRIVAEAAERYSSASEEYKAAQDSAKDSAEDAFEGFEAALDKLKTPRIDPRPPGRNGCIAFAIDISSRSVPAAFSSGFVGMDATLPPRVAISSAALVEDQAGEGNSILSAFLDRAKAQSVDAPLTHAGLGIFDGILGLWGDMLVAYTSGTEMLVAGVGDLLRTIPLINSTPLAAWAEKALREGIEMVGLQGVDLSAPKPVIVNTMHVINAGDSKALQMLGRAKTGYMSLAGDGSGGLESVVDGILVEVQNQGNDLLDSEFTLFTITFDDIPGAPEIPIKVKLPTNVADQGKSMLGSVLSAVRDLIGGFGNDTIWE